MLVHRVRHPCQLETHTQPLTPSPHRPLPLPLQHFCLYPAHDEGRFWPDASQQQQQQQGSGNGKKALASSSSDAISVGGSSSRGPDTPSPSGSALAAPAALAAAASEADLEAARHGIEPAAEQEQAPLLRR